MTKLLCSNCNNSINTSYEPNHAELFIFDEAQLEDNGRTILMEAIMKDKNYTYAIKCPECGAIHIFGDKKDFNKVTEVYIKKENCLF